ncbi:class I mannose-6-phosphate isomerase, partial [Bacteroidales bacterium OttesenSCG-928-C19]|nr:class I mannose-6-phosphate isomerase [Bacteroidales bacterium OttesenSCG-928-C19]
DGFNKNTSAEEFKSNLERKEVTKLLNFEKVEKGDVFFIPAKRIHALCEGTLLAEIQQSSDTTYRVYDWNRVDENGKSRELHIDQAMDSIDFSKITNAKTEYQYQLNKTTELVQSNFFVTNLLHLDHAIEKDFSSLDSFVIYLCFEGGGVLKALDTVLEFKAGECLLLPAITTDVEFHPVGEMKMLEVFIQ